MNKNILYVGNDHGVYISFDQGKNWEPFSKGLTSAAVHDLVIQTNEKHLLVGTHGRSIYLADIKKIQDLSDAILESSLYIYPLDNIKKSNSWGVQRSIWSQAYSPKLDITLFSSSSTSYNILINDTKGNNVYKSEGKLDKGFNFINYNLMNNNEYLDKGVYKVLIITDKDNLEKEFKIQ